MHPPEKESAHDKSRGADSSNHTGLVTLSYAESLGVRRLCRHFAISIELASVVVFHAYGEGAFHG